MLIQAAISLGVETAVYDPAPDSPASRLTHHHAVGAWDDRDALLRFAEGCDLITLENEFILADSLRALVAAGIPVVPSPGALAIIQDKYRQKRRYQEAGLAVPLFAAVESPDAVVEFARAHGYPLVLKARYGGYDGYGNATVRADDDLPAAWVRLSANGARALMVEAFVPFVRELAVMLLRGRDGETRAYPVVETVQQNHICHLVRAPAPIPDDLAAAARSMAAAAVTALDGVGVFGVELFQMADGTLLLNEIAPRPHNSGHYSIEGCVTSQFENHLRAVLGWPLGSTMLRAPAVVMVNLLGTRAGPVESGAPAEALVVEGAHLHLYGKRESRMGRKMGHVTALAATLDEAEAVARRAAALVRV
jgi:5-(carboxyamino)imidazole ribonucleotide synthase